MKTTILQSHLLILLATVIIAGSFISSEYLTKVLNPFSLTLFRFVSSALILLPIVLIKKRWRDKILITMPRALVISLFFSLFFIFFFEALHTTTALNTGCLYTAIPLFTAFLAKIILKESLNFTTILIYLAGVFGSCWVIFDGDINLLLSFSLNGGDFIFLVASFFMCCYSIAMKALYKDDEMIVLVFCVLIGGSIWMSMGTVLMGLPLEWELITGAGIYHMAYLSIACTLLTVYLYQKVVVILGPSKIMAYIYLNPALVAILLYLINDLPIVPAVIPGIILTIIVTVILQKTSKI